MKKSVVGLSLILVIVLTASTAFAVCTPPSDGDWVFGGVVQCDLQDVLINGNIFINDSASLTLNSTNITLNSSFDREFGIFVSEDGQFHTSSARFYRINDTFDIEANGTSTLNLTGADLQAGITIRLTETATSTFFDVNHSDDINTNNFGTHTWTNLHVYPDEETGTQTIVFIDDNSTVTIIDSTLEGRVKFGQNVGAFPNVTIYNGNLSGDVELRRSAFVDFKTTSYINATNLYAQTPVLTGNVTFLSTLPATSFAATSYTRFYPVYVTDPLDNPLSGQMVNITNSTGSVLWSGITDASGYVLANMTYSLALCSVSGANCDNDFNISTNASEILGIQTNTPVILIVNIGQAIPEFGEWIMILMVAGLLGSLFYMRRK